MIDRRWTTSASRDRARTQEKGKLSCCAGYTCDSLRRAEFKSRTSLDSHDQLQNKIVLTATGTHSTRFPMVLYAIVMLGSALLFQIQLVIGKMILPQFGGAPSVWSTSILTFQILLLLGYVYAHLLLAKLDLRKQAIFHIVLLICSALIDISVMAVWHSPIVPLTFWKPKFGVSPVWEVVRVLLITTGLSVVILSSTTPILQRWFGQDGRRSYRVYSFSNFGSMIGLLTYPFLLEKIMTLHMQVWLWALGYFVFLVACASVGSIGILLAVQVPGVGASARREPLPITTAPLWLAFAACGSILLLATTNLICQDLGAIPVLWVIPLGLYLASFVICFAHPHWYRRELFQTAFVVFTLASLRTLANALDTSFATQIGIYCATLFTACMVCHGELAMLKPRTAEASLFYLVIGAGGALGSALVILVAPHVFRNYWEFQLGLLSCGILLILAVIRDRSSWFHKRQLNRWLLAGSTVMALFGFYGFSLALLKSEGEHFVVWRTRNFFGVKTVLHDAQGFWLKNGRTMHGMQYEDPRLRKQATLYYQPQSGIGLLLRDYPRTSEATGSISRLRVGVVGLGAGTLASYGTLGDYFRFYEVDPSILALSMGQNPFFTFLQTSPASIDIVDGDARTSMREEAITHDLQKFDVLVIDAFTGAAIPVHLLTREAMGIYLQEMRGPNSVIAFHITNRELDLRPVIQALNSYYHLFGVEVHASGAGDWVLSSANPKMLQLPGLAAHSEQLSVREVPWTDDFGSVMTVFRK